MLDTSARYYMKIQDKLGENKEMDKTEKFYSLYEVLKLYDIKRSGNGSVYENDADVRKLLISRWKKACNMFLPKMYADYLLKDSDSVQRGKYERFTESEKDFFIELLHKYDSDPLWKKLKSVNRKKRRVKSKKAQECSEEEEVQKCNEAEVQYFNEKYDFVDLFEKKYLFKGDERDRAEQEILWAIDGFYNILKSRMTDPEEREACYFILYVCHKAAKVAFKVNKDLGEFNIL